MHDLEFTAPLLLYTVSDASTDSYRTQVNVLAWHIDCAVRDDDDL